MRAIFITMDSMFPLKVLVINVDFQNEAVQFSSILFNIHKLHNKFTN